MRNLVFFALLTAAVATAFPRTTSTQTPTKATDQNASIEQGLLQLTRDWLAAEERHDRETLKRIIADDFQGTAPMGQTVFKEDVIPIEGSEARGLAISPSELKARVFGDTAVVTGRWAQKAGENKREVRFTVVYAKRDNRWQMVAAHLAAVPKE